MRISKRVEWGIYVALVALILASSIVFIVYVNIYNASPW
jgi:hypothetical protein